MSSCLTELPSVLHRHEVAPHAQSMTGRSSNVDVRAEDADIGGGTAAGPAPRPSQAGRGEGALQIYTSIIIIILLGTHEKKKQIMLWSAVPLIRMLQCVR